MSPIHPPPITFILRVVKMFTRSEKKQQYSKSDTVFTRLNTAAFIIL